MVSQTETGSGRPYSPAQVRRLTDFDLTLPALGLLILFFVLPVAMLLTRSVTEPVPGLGNYAELLAHQLTCEYSQTPSSFLASSHLSRC